MFDINHVTMNCDFDYCRVFLNISRRKSLKTPAETPFINHIDVDLHSCRGVQGHAPPERVDKNGAIC